MRLSKKQVEKFCNDNGLVFIFQSDTTGKYSFREQDDFNNQYLLSREDIINEKVF